jgi:Flp pilus assembly pilin Flp
MTMAQLMRKLWQDDCGALISSEFLFVATILVIGVIIGLTALRSAVNAELTQLGNAFLALSQGYTISGQSSSSAQVDGSMAIDSPQLLTSPTLVPPANPSTITVPVQ